jgi:hypothetical protein
MYNIKERYDFEVLNNNITAKSFTVDTDIIILSIDSACVSIKGVKIETEKSSKKFKRFTQKRLKEREKKGEKEGLRI